MARHHVSALLAAAAPRAVAALALAAAPLAVAIPTAGAPHATSTPYAGECTITAPDAGFHAMKWPVCAGD